MHQAPLKAFLWIASSVVLCGCAAPKASIVAERQPWLEEDFAGRRLETEHFVVYSTLTDAEFEGALPTFVEAAYQCYEKTLPGPGSAEKLTTYVFGSRSQWERFTRRRFPVRADLYQRIRCGGFTEGSTATTFSAGRSPTLATLAHEGWHQYVGSRFSAALPAWLNEGLACCHEAVEWSSDAPVFTPGRNTFRMNALRDGLFQQRLLSLSELVDTDAAEVLRRDRSGAAQVYYAQAWGLVTFLRHGAEGRYAKSFERLLSDISTDAYRIKLGAARLSATGGEEASVGRAVFEAYFGVAPDALAGEYETYLRHLASGPNTNSRP